MNKTLRRLGRRSPWRRRSWALALGVTLTCLLTAACGSGGPAGKGSDDTLSKIRESGVVRVGFANEAPFAYSSSDGKLIGMMPLVMQYIFKQIGDIKLEGVLTDFNGLIPGLQANRIDAVGAGLYISPERCKQATPANPQFTGAEGMAVLKGNPKDIHNYGDLKEHGARFGTVSGSINLQYATSAGVPKGDVQLFPDVPSAIAGLKAHRVDAVGMSVVSLQNVMGKSKDTSVELAEPFDQPGNANSYGAVYFPKGATSVVKAYNAELAKALKSGKLLELYQSLGFDKRVLPPPGLTAAELCKG